ncbi:MAG: DUF4339 domain-containing protein [Thermoguttaceae bacterium]
MGIRFFCPNGHKLNVKSHLAGMAGYCPDCGERLVIPMTSTRLSSKLGGGPIAAATAEAVDPHDDVRVAAHDDLLADNNVANDVFADADIVELLEADDDDPPTPHGASAASGRIPPCLAVEGIEWFLQIPGGKQYGPLTGEVLFSWLREKRLSGDMLLWRDGWHEWLEARKVIPPQLFPKIGAK